MTKKKEETKENPHLSKEDKEKIEESMKKQVAPEEDPKRKQLEDEIMAKIEEDKKRHEELDEVREAESEKSEEEKQAEKIVEEAADKPEKAEEPLPEGVEAVEETTDDRGPSIKEEQARATADAKKFDICPFCGTHAMEGAIQPKIPLPIGEQAILIALPLLVCVRCTNVYMPRSFVQQLLTPETEKPKIITP